VLSLIAVFAGKPGRYASLRGVFESKMYMGKLSAEDRAAILGEVQAKLRSKSSAIVALEISDDPDAELRLIKTEDEKYPTAPSIDQFAQVAGGMGQNQKQPAAFGGR
jgi:hypothetical protein